MTSYDLSSPATSRKQEWVSAKNHKWVLVTLTPWVLQLGWIIPWYTVMSSHEWAASGPLLGPWKDLHEHCRERLGVLSKTWLAKGAFVNKDHCFLYGETPNTDPMRMITASSPACHRIGASPRLQTRSVEVWGPKFCWIGLSQPNCQPPTLGGEMDFKDIQE